MIAVESAEFRHRGGFRLGPVTLTLGAGVHHLHGTNGSGKTTLMRLLCGDLRPRRGTVRICGADPRHHRARRAVTWMPAACDLPPFLTTDEAWKAAAALRGRADWDGTPLMEALQLPAGLPLEHASAGQRQKAALIAALAGDPAVLLLDEPFANLDTEAVAAMTGLLPTDRCILITAHADLPLPTHSHATLHPGQPLDWSGN